MTNQIRVFAGFLIGTYVATIVYSLDATGWDAWKAFRFSIVMLLATVPLMIVLAVPTYLLLKKLNLLNLKWVLLGSFSCVFLGLSVILLGFPLAEFYREGELVIVEEGRYTPEGRLKNLKDLFVISVYASIGGFVFWIVAVKDWKKHLTRS